MMRRAVEVLARRLTNRGLQKGIVLEAASCGHQRGHATTSTTYYHEQELPVQRGRPVFSKEEKLTGLTSSSGRSGWWRSMFIQTQPTPNPSSLMFLPGKPVMKEGSREFKSVREAMVSPLAKKLFTIDGVQAVFFGSDFVTVTKTDDAVWQVMKPDVYAAIMDFYSSQEDLFTDAEVLAQSDTAIHEDDDEVVAMVKELLDTRIRPAVQEDGGDIMFRGFDHDTGIVRLKMQGACSGCPSSSATLKHGIENMLMHYIPEVKEVVEDFDEEQQESLKQFESLERSLESQLSP